MKRSDVTPNGVQIFDLTIAGSKRRCAIAAFDEGGYFAASGDKTARGKTRDDTREALAAELVKK